MKRIIAVILVITLALTALSGCALKKKLTAFGLYSKAVSTIRDAGGMEADCAMVMDLSLLSVEMNMNIKMNGDDSEITLSMGGEQLTKTTTVGDTVYIEASGIKTCMPKEESSHLTKDEISALPKLTEDMFNDIEIVEDENGGKALTVSIGGDTLSSVFESFSSEALEGISFNDAEVTMYFNSDDEIESMHVDSNAEMSSMGLSMKMNIVIDYTFINLGTAPEINVPEDADEYVFVDMNEAA